MERLARPAVAHDTRELPATLADLKEHVRVEHSDEDRRLLQCLMSAVVEAEQYLGSPIMARQYTLALAAFPGEIELPNPPIRSVDSVTYYDSDGVTQTVDAATYELHQHSAFPTVRLVPGATWPSTQIRENAVTVTYTAGYATKASSVPAPISEAVLLRAGTRYDNRAETGTGSVAWKLPDDLTFRALLDPFRVARV